MRHFSEGGLSAQRNSRTPYQGRRKILKSGGPEVGASINHKLKSFEEEGSASNSTKIWGGGVAILGGGAWSDLSFPPPIPTALRISKRSWNKSAQGYQAHNRDLQAKIALFRGLGFALQQKRPRSSAFTWEWHPFWNSLKWLDRILKTSLLPRANIQINIPWAQMRIEL